MPPQGLEPWTRGLRVRCSSQLSYEGDTSDCNTTLFPYTTLGRNAVGAGVARTLATLDPVFKEIFLTVTVRLENFSKSPSVRVDGDFTMFKMKPSRSRPSALACARAAR